MSETTLHDQVTNKPQRWQDYSPAKKTRITAQGLVNLVLIVWAVRDLRQRPDSGINGTRKIWGVAAFAPPFGLIAYLVFGRKREAQMGEEHVIDDRTGD